jgi:hypothetical protein
MSDSIILPNEEGKVEFFQTQTKSPNWCRGIVDNHTIVTGIHHPRKRTKAQADRIPRKRCIECIIH